MVYSVGTRQGKHMAQETLLLMRGVSKRFGGLTALDKVDFEVNAGETHALVG